MKFVGKALRVRKLQLSKFIFSIICLAFFLVSTAFNSIEHVEVKQNKTSPQWEKVKDYFKPKPNDKDFATNGTLSEVLNEDGTVKKGAEGSFDPKGYNMTYGANGQPIFKPMGAGDERWQSMPNSPVGVNGVIYAIATTSQGVYVGGSFTSAGGITVSNIAFWNGSAWQTLGTGVNGIVKALAVSGSSVYVGGEFTTAGGLTANRLAVWNGTTWSTIGSVTGTRINSISISGTNVYVGGLFSTIGSTNANNVAMWNGTTWSALNTGVNGEVLVVKANGSSLYVGGAFTAVGAGNVISRAFALWNGTAWETLGTTFMGDNGFVNAITISGTNVYVGGSFTSIRGFAANRIAIWNGTNWSSLGTPNINTILSIFVRSTSEIFVGGFGSSTDLLRWNGSSWADSGDGINGTVHALEIFEPSLNFIAGGNFDTLNNSTVVNNIARPVDFFSNRLGPVGYGVNVTYGGNIATIAISGSNVYVGGNFRSIGTTSANNIAFWDGSNWNTLGSGTNGRVSAIAISGSNVFVGGQFTSAGTTSANNIAEWNSSSSNWSALGSGITGGGFGGTLVFAIEVVGSDVFVGGNFTNAGGTSASAIARWNTNTRVWSALSSGLTGTSFPYVRDIKSYNSGVVVVGRFTTAGGSIPANNIAFWNGSWSTNNFGGGLVGGDGISLAVNGSNLIVGGNFTTAGGRAVNRIGVWNGTEWFALGAGVNSSVNDIFLRANNVYVVGNFTSAGGNSANRIAMWNGQTWSTLGTGLNDNAIAIAGTSSNLYVGGSFSTTGDGSIGALGIIQRNGLIPVATLQNPAALSDPKGVKLNGTVSPGGLSGTYYFEYGITSTNLNLQTTVTAMSGSTDIAVSADVFAAAANTTYFYRLRAENAEGVALSPIQSYVFPPDIEVRQNVTVLPSGSEYDFGNVNYLASSSVISFSINNLGLAPLNLTGSPLISITGTNAGDFALVQGSVNSIAFNGSQNFTIQFNPQGGGVRTAILSIPNNDTNESPYIINLKGTGIKLNQTITFNPLTTRTVGDVPFTISATSTSGLPVSFSSATPSVATISGSTVTIVGAGTTIITASQAGNDNFNAATSVQQTLTVRAAEPGAQPTNLTFNNRTTSSLNGAFTAATGSPAGYLVLRRAGAAPTFVPVDGNAYANGTTQGDAFVVASAAATTFADAGLVAGTTYHYAVYAFNGSGVTANYRTTTPLASSTITVSSAPVAIAASNINQTSFRANWNASTGAANYFLDVSSDNFSTLLTGYAAKSVSGLNDVVTGLNPGITYQYRVRANNAAGLSSNSNTISQITVPATPVVNAATEVRTNDFRITWTAITGASGYQVDVSSDNFLSFVSGFQNKSLGQVNQELVTGLSPFTDYQYRIRAVNSGGVSTSSNVGTVKTLSANPPLGVTSPVYNATTSKVTVTLSGGTGTPVVRFYSRGITQDDFKAPVNLTPVSLTTTYEVTITPSLLDELGLEYYFTAEDAATTTPVLAPATGSNYIYKQITQGQITFPGLSFGGNIENYRVISVPYALTINSPSIIFSPLGAYDKTKWRLLQLSGTSFTDNPNAMVPGRAYWFNAREQAPIELGAGSVVPNNQSDDFEFNLQQGWNMIATPFPFSITWDDVLDKNPTANVDADYLVFNPSSIAYDVSNNMKPFEGGFVFANAATELRFPVTLKNGVAGRTKDVTRFEKSLDAENWEVSIRMQQSGKVNNLIAVGMHKEAQQGKDRFDRATLPAFINQPELYTETKDVFAPYLLRDVVNRAGEYAWNFSVLAEDGSPVTLTWDQEAIQFNRSQLLLYDQQENVLIDMRNTASYSFMPTKGKKLQFIYSSEALEIKNNIGNAAPNPFITETKLPGYLNSSTQKTKVKVSIKTLTGVEVFYQTYDIENLGLHQPVWNGTNFQGETLKSGLYLYQVNYFNATTNTTHTGKIIKQ